MKFIKTPVKGMPEYTPADMLLREYVLSEIKSTYGRYGFCMIETPAVEHIENLTNKQGGENETLIFRILKRGDKLAKETHIDNMCDSGLRYDLTVPLARFYANNNNNLPTPFKAMQIGPVWRADRPQKGRFRQFTQCDIDIIGDKTNLAEIELISATSGMLCQLNLGNLTVRVNDRRILKSMVTSCGLPEDKLDSILIILDKYDKIGVDGVCSELLKMGLEQESVQKYCRFFSGERDHLQYFKQQADVVDSDVIINLERIIDSVRGIVPNNVSIVFDPALVRGMSYYTGSIFEIELETYHLSIAGGGRYDEMIGKYSGNDVPACGFSIGFERLISILKENNTEVMGKKAMSAFLISKDVSLEKTQEVLAKAHQLRQGGETVLVSVRNKNAKAQKEKLRTIGYEVFIDVYNDTQIR